MFHMVNGKNKNSKNSCKQNKNKESESSKKKMNWRKNRDWPKLNLQNGKN